MTARPLSLVLLTAVLVATAGPASAARAAQARPAQGRAGPARSAPAPAATQGADPAGLLKPDGTLRLDGQFHGALDVHGWDVRLDPTRGPVFAPGGGGATVPPGQWASLGGGASAFDDRVDALAVSGSTVYASGELLDADSRGVGADYLAKWNGSTWSAVDPNFHFDGNVYAVAVSGSTLYAGGSFTSISGPSGPIPGTRYLAQWNGTSWSAVGGDGAGGSSLDRMVMAIAITGTSVYVGGDFTSAKNPGSTLTAAAYVARWDTQAHAWSALGHGATLSSSALNDRVSALAVFGSNVYVGGLFTDTAGLPAADYVAQWNGNSWSALSHGAGGNGSLNSEVKTLATDGSGNLFVGGVFTDVVDGFWGTLNSADYIARWDGTFWHSMGGGGPPTYGALNGEVYSIAISGTTVYAGGSFTNTAGLAAADYVAAANWNTGLGQYTWAALSDNGSGQGSLQDGVLALAADGAGHLYVGGNSEYVADSGSLVDNATYLAAWDGTHWSALTDQPNGALNTVSDDTGVLAAVVSGTDVYVGGSFMDVHDGANILTAADFVAKWDGAKWWALGSNGAKQGALSYFVDALVITGTTLYAGGFFGSVNDQGTLLPNAAHVAAYNLSTGHWSALGYGAALSTPALNGDVEALAVSANTLYVGGEFTSVNNKGTPLAGAAHLAQWNISTGDWSAFSSQTGFNGQVDAILVNGPAVYVGGTFTDVHDSSGTLAAADYVAKWDGAHWSALGSGAGGQGALNNSVYALAAIGTSIYAGGTFTSTQNIGTVVPGAQRVARWDTGTGQWSALGHNGVAALNGPVDALTAAGSDLYVGGTFTDVNDGGSVLPAADYVARWDGTHWWALGGGDAGDGALSHYVMTQGGNGVLALAVQGKILYSGGVFLDVSNHGAVLPAADYFAAFGLGTQVFMPLVRR